MDAAATTKIEFQVKRAVVAALAASAVVGAVMLVLPALHCARLGVAFVTAAVLGVAARPWRLTNSSLWTCSLLFFTALAGVTVQGIIATNAHRDVLPQLGNQLVDEHQVDAYLDSIKVVRGALRIQTGVFLTHMEFASSNNVQASGYVWQIYPPDTPKDLDRGVVFPEAINGGYDDVQPAYDITRPDGMQVLGWHFDLTLRQRFDYAKYPFDQQDVWFRMWCKDFDQAAILVPDFESHPRWAPKSLIGLEQQFVFSGWSPVFTGYGYLENRYTSSFGLGKYETKPPFPEMVYTVSLRRLSTGPFVNHVIPLIVIYVLTFAILLFMVKDEERSFNILGALAGLFFLALINHQQIYSAAAADGLSLLGAASAILYASFFAVAANGFALVRLDLPLLDWRHNLLARLVFLPTTALMMAIVSVRIL
jgi:hypothetical protein